MLSVDNLGLALRLLRTTRNQKQRHVASRAGITAAMLSSYETGRTRPTVATLEKILEAMDCTLADLAGALRKIADRKAEQSAAGLEVAPLFGEADSLCRDVLSREEREAWGDVVRIYCRWREVLRACRAKADEATGPDSRG